MKYGIVILLLAVGCQRAPEAEKKSLAGSGLNTKGVKPDMVLAQVGNVAITVADFQGEIDRQAPHLRVRYRTEHNKKSLLDAMIRFEILAQAAEKKGLSKDPEVTRMVKQAMIDKLYRAEMSGKSYSPSESEVRDYYDNNQASFFNPNRVRAAAVATRTRSAANRVLAKAKLLKPAEHAKFRGLVEQYGVSKELSQRSGDLGFLQKDSKKFPSEIVDAVFSLASNGDVVGPIKSKDKYYVIRRTEYRPSYTTSFEKAKSKIKSKLTRSNRRAFEKSLITKLRKSAKIEIFSEKLKSLRVKTKKDKPK